MNAWTAQQLTVKKKKEYYDENQLDPLLVRLIRPASIKAVVMPDVFMMPFCTRVVNLWNICFSLIF